MLDELMGKSEIELDNLSSLKMKLDENSFKKSQRSPVEQGLAPQPAELYRREQENFAGLSNKEENIQGKTSTCMEIGLKYLKLNRPKTLLRGFVPMTKQVNMPHTNSSI